MTFSILVVLELEDKMETIFVRRRPDSVMEWTVEDVADWLKQFQLDKYCKRFQS